jgi:hypothetical protein
MEGGLEGNITAELINKKLPFTVTADESEADYILTGQSSQGTNKWYDTAFGIERDRVTGAVRLIRVEGRQVVWAGEAGDRNLMFGAGLFGDSGGKRTVAQRIVKQLKKALEDKRVHLVGSSDGFKAAQRAPISAVTVVRDAPATKPAPTPAPTPEEPKAESKPEPKRADEPDPDVTILIETQPAGAEIDVDGKFLGTTPSRIALKPGPHMVRLSLTGYTLWAREVYLTKGSDPTFKVSLSKQ